MKIQQKSLLQTGVLIVEMPNGEEKQIPLFSKKPQTEEIPAFKKRFPNIEVKQVFFTSTLLGYRIVETVEEVVGKRGFLPENYMNEIRSGFPFIHSSINYNPLPIGISYC